jgi:hypothetical protein
MILAGREHEDGCMADSGTVILCRKRRKRIPPKYYRIGELVEYSPFSRQTIHNYTSMGLIREVRWTPGGHRLYDGSVFDRLDTIAELKSQRKSLSFIRDFLSKLDRAEKG